MRRIKFLKDVTLRGVLNLELVQSGDVPEKKVKVAFRKNQVVNLYEWAKSDEASDLATDNPALMGPEAAPGDTLTFPDVSTQLFSGEPAWEVVEKSKPVPTKLATRLSYPVGSHPLLDGDLDGEESDAVLS